MIYQSLTSSISGTDTMSMDSYIFGGAIISTNGTNAATVIIREDGATGDVLLHVSTITPMEILKPIRSKSTTIYYSITGTGASAQLFQWLN